MVAVATVVVPSAEALTTSLGESARDALVTLAKALAQEIQATNDPAERRKTTHQFITVVAKINGMDLAVAREARALARAEAAIDWMARRDQERAMVAARRAAEIIAREQPKETPASSVIDDLRLARERRTKRRGTA